MNQERFEHLKKDYVQGFPAFCGFEVIHAEYGKFETRLWLKQKHLQQDGFVHAGVIATMADHTAGYSGYTVVSDKYRILTIEFKINYLRPAKGKALICRSNVIHQGKMIIVAESEIFSISDSNQEKMVSKAVVTLTPVDVDKLGLYRNKIQ